MGELIEFYRPTPKAVLTVATPEQLLEEPSTPAKQVLTQCLEHVDTIDQIVVLTMDKDGVLGFLGNCEGLAETLLFLELIKAQMLFSRVDSTPNGDKIT